MLYPYPTTVPLRLWVPTVTCPVQICSRVPFVISEGTPQFASAAQVILVEVGHTALVSVSALFRMSLKLAFSLSFLPASLAVRV